MKKRNCTGENILKYFKNYSNQKQKVQHYMTHYTYHLKEEMYKMEMGDNIEK